ncbi:MAG: hypothetical protein ACXVWU_12580 [Nocardioides sp.]
MTEMVTAQCSPGVHTFYAGAEQATAIARAKSRDGLFYVAQKCTACSGWRLKRVS